MVTMATMDDSAAMRTLRQRLGLAVLPNAVVAWCARLAGTPYGQLALANLLDDLDSPAAAWSNERRDIKGIAAMVSANGFGEGSEGCTVRRRMS